jgi:hypothetical protein
MSVHHINGKAIAQMNQPELFVNKAMISEQIKAKKLELDNLINTHGKNTPAYKQAEEENAILWGQNVQIHSALSTFPLARPK